MDTNNYIIHVVFELCHVSYLGSLKELISSEGALYVMMT